MFSFLSSFNQARAQSKLLKAQAGIMRSNAQGVRNRANAQAAAIEHAARQNQLIEAENLAAARTNQRAATGTARAARSGSGFSSEDSGSQSAENIQEALDKHIANMALSASISMSNSWHQAIDTRRQGEVEAYAMDVQADQYQAQAKSIRKAANISLVTGILGSAAGAYMGYTKAGEYNQAINDAWVKSDVQLAEAYDAGLITESQYNTGLERNIEMFETLQVNPFESAFTQASNMGGMAYHSMSSFSPYIASFSADANARKNNWGGMLSVISGNVPYKVPSAGTIFSNYI